MFECLYCHVVCFDSLNYHILSETRKTAAVLGLLGLAPTRPRPFALLCLWLLMFVLDNERSKFLQTKFDVDVLFFLFNECEEGDLLSGTHSDHHCLSWLDRQASYWVLRHLHTTDFLQSQRVEG